MKRIQALQIMDSVRQAYNTIAQDYYRDRQRSWPVGRAVAPLLTKYIKSDMKVLDIGSGSGQLIPALAKLDIPLQYTGCDMSESVVELSKTKFKTKYSQLSLVWQVASITELPFVDSDFDVVCALAVLHHVPSRELRLQALKEVYRVLQPGGVLIMTNWALDSDTAKRKFNLRWQQFKNIWKGFDFRDYAIPWKASSGKVQAMRYYHSFVEAELTGLLTQAGFSSIDTKRATLTTCPKSPAISWLTTARK